MTSAAKELRKLFRRSAYIRRFSPERRKREGPAYKKGSEVRFVVSSKTELSCVRRLLRAVGLRPGRPFAKHSRFVQPVYGRRAVDLFTRKLRGRKK